MDIKLTAEQLGQIIYAMENQEKRCLIDIRTGEVTSGAEIETSEPDKNLISPPEWKPRDGYNLMLKFVNALKNQLFKDELRRVLSGGEGVFKKFKSVLKKNKEIEMLWYSFKEKEMRRIIFEWYNMQREAQGLESLGPEPEETEELILSDFILEWWDGKDIDVLSEMDKRAFFEVFVDWERSRTTRVYLKRRSRKRSMVEGKIVAAKTPGGNYTGFIWGEEEKRSFPDETVWRIIQYVIIPEYRALGLGKALLNAFLHHAREAGVKKVAVRLEQSSLNLEVFFQSKNFHTVAQTMECEL